MRAFLLASAIGSLSAPCAAVEAYQLTGRAYGACVGENMRYRYETPTKLLDTINTRCGKLEQQEEEQFGQFLADRIGRELTAELALEITLHNSMNPSKLKHIAIEAYFKAVKPEASRPQPSKPDVKLPPPLSLSR
jgi:hypothetical protein